MTRYFVTKPFIPIINKLSRAASWPGSHEQGIHDQTTHKLINKNNKKVGIWAQLSDGYRLAFMDELRN